MLVTLNSDASWHPKIKTGAYAFWIVSNEFKIKKAGYFKDKCVSSHEAEMKAILNALTVLLSTKDNITKIIINTDSKNSISVFKNTKKNIQKYNLKKYKKYRIKYHSINNKYSNFDKTKKNIEYDFRHVKAHSGKNDKRSYVNEWCDENAKRFLWRKIHKDRKMKIVNFLANGPSEEKIEEFYVNEILPFDKRSIEEILKT